MYLIIKKVFNNSIKVNYKIYNVLINANIVRETLIFVYYVINHINYIMHNVLMNVLKARRLINNLIVWNAKHK